MDLPSPPPAPLYQALVREYLKGNQILENEALSSPTPPPYYGGFQSQDRLDTGDWDGFGSTRPLLSQLGYPRLPGARGTV